MMDRESFIKMMSEAKLHDLTQRLQYFYSPLAR